MLNSGPHNKAVQPCSSRRMESGDLLLTELSPIYKGQMTQICRTIVMGRATADQKRCYQILIDGYENGEKAARPGVPMSRVCDAVDEVIDGAGYAEYGRPPYLRLRRRGHGLGFGCDLPGDVGPDNDIVLQKNMVFVLHPNQYLPETGYMMCGEPLLITATGSEALSKTKAVLGEIG
jgi:Xaa-Pro aminopeptidase